MSEGDAEISDDKVYRYWLMRQWDTSLPLGAFCSLNPSTADARDDDPTIRKDIGFAKLWGWGGFFKFNLFPYRSTDPKSLWAADDPVGPRGDEMIQRMATQNYANVVAAWGAQKHPRFTARVSRVLQLLADVPLWCIGEPTKDGHPRHPLYMPYSAPLKLWRSVGAAHPDLRRWKEASE